MKLTMKRRYLLDLLQQFLKYGLETKKKKKKISTTGNTAKLLSCQNRYDH